MVFKIGSLMNSELPMTAKRAVSGDDSIAFANETGASSGSPSSDPSSPSSDSAASKGDGLSLK